MATRACINLASRPARSCVEGVAVDVLSADAIRAIFASSSALRALGRYEAVELLVEDARALLSIKPQLAARWLSRGRCRIVDDRGFSRDLGVGYLAAAVARGVSAAMTWPIVRARIAANLNSLNEPLPVPRAGIGPPLYLRCDIAYGLKAGGSLGHIGGVVNGLRAVGLEPVVASVERPNTVPQSVPMIQLDPGPPRWVHTEQALLAFNSRIIEQVQRAWKGALPRFIYQRHALGAFAGVALARRFGVPLVLEYNGPEVWVAQHWGSGLKELHLFKACEDTVLRRASLIVTVSDVLTRDLATRGIEAHRLVTIPNGVDLDLFRPDRDVSALRTRLGLDQKTVIGFIGTFGPWHGAEVLVEAFARMLAEVPDLRPSTRLLLVGDGVRMAAVRALIERLGLTRIVITSGLVPQTAGPDHIALFDIAVAPTVPNPDGTAFFGSPTKLFEYMAAGRAIVASDLGQVGEVLSNEGTGLLVPGGDAGALARALTRLVRDPDLRRRLGAAARSEAKLRHSHDARTAQLLRMLERFQ